MKTICIKIYGNIVDFILVKNFNGNINTCKITENNEFFFTTDYFCFLHILPLFLTIETFMILA